MTNKEILQANLLDIVFEHRNKNYGAYALRKTYPQRLQWALGICLGIPLLLLMINFFVNQNNGSGQLTDKGIIELTAVSIEPKQPEQLRPIEKMQTAKIKETTITVVPDNRADKLIPSISDLDTVAISDHTQ